MSKPKFVYVTYIRTTPEKLWAALTDPAFSRQYFFGFAVDVEPKAGGAFYLRHPDGRVHVSGQVAEWAPPRRFACTWRVESMPGFAELPECLVTYAIEPAGDSVKLTMTESHSWDVPEAILSGSRAGWPAILSSFKSLLETGKPLSVKLEPPSEMLAALRSLKLP
jgi:uncharacterized protein YndB with AHSA1/START domain